MSPKPAPHAHQVRIREISTGRVFHAWPVDAREMLNHPKGGFEAVSADAPLGSPEVAPVAPLPPPTHTSESQLEAKSYKELQVLAKRAGINAGQNKEALVLALLAHIEAGTVSIEELPKVVADPVQFPNAIPE